MEAWLPWVERLGIPVIFLGIVLFIGYKMVMAVYDGLKPFAKTAWERTLSFVDTIEDCQRKIVDAQETQSHLLVGLSKENLVRSQQVDRAMDQLMTAAERLMPPDMADKARFHFDAVRRQLRGT